MADISKPIFPSISNFGNADFALGKEYISPEITAKQERVKRVAEAKALLFGGEDALRAAATARIQGNDAGKTEFQNDLGKYTR